MTAEVEKVILTCILIGKIRHSALFSDRAYLLLLKYWYDRQRTELLIKDSEGVSQIEEE